MAGLEPANSEPSMGIEPALPPYQGGVLPLDDDGVAKASGPGAFSGGPPVTVSAANFTLSDLFDNAFPARPVLEHLGDIELLDPTYVI